MKIVIAGDNHGEIHDLERIVQREKNVDLFLHTGDSLSSPWEIEPFVAVRGNCDYDEEYPESRIIQTPQGKLLITHGNFLYKYNLSYLKENNIKFFITGHTHCHKNSDVDGLLFFNPGSTSFPRDGTFGTYLVLEIDKSRITHKFKTLYKEHTNETYQR